MGWGLEVALLEQMTLCRDKNKMKERAPRVCGEGVLHTENLEQCW